MLWKMGAAAVVAGGLYLYALGPRAPGAARLHNTAFDTASDVITEVTTTWSTAQLVSRATSGSPSADPRRTQAMLSSYRRLGPGYGPEDCTGGATFADWPSFENARAHFVCDVTFGEGDWKVAVGVHLHHSKGAWLVDGFELGPARSVTPAWRAQ